MKVMHYKTPEEIERVKREKIFGINKFQLFMFKLGIPIPFGRSTLFLEEIAKNIEEFAPESIPQDSTSIEQAKKLIEEYKISDDSWAVLLRGNEFWGSGWDIVHDLKEVINEKTGETKYRFISRQYVPVPGVPVFD